MSLSISWPTWSDLDPLCVNLGCYKLEVLPRNPMRLMARASHMKIIIFSGNSISNKNLSDLKCLFIFFQKIRMNRKFEFYQRRFSLSSGRGSAGRFLPRLLVPSSSSPTANQRTQETLRGNATPP
jgi:hypothetical protein